MTPIAARLAELRKPIAPEFRDDRWYYAGFSQYLKGEAFEHYNRDLADYYKASLKLALEVLEEADECLEYVGIQDPWVDFDRTAKAKELVRVTIEAMKE